MLVLSVMVVMLGVISCCSEPPVETPPDRPGVEVVELKEITSKAVFLRPVNGDPDVCVVVPDALHMGASGITWVTFVNETVHDAEIKFDTSDTIGNVTNQPVDAGEAESFKLTDPTTNRTHTYTVAAKCYTPPLAGPRIIIP